MADQLPWTHLVPSSKNTCLHLWFRHSTQCTSLLSKNNSYLHFQQEIFWLLLFKTILDEFNLFVSISHESSHESRMCKLCNNTIQNVLISGMCAIANKIRKLRYYELKATTYTHMCGDSNVHVYTRISFMQSSYICIFSNSLPPRPTTATKSCAQKPHTHKWQEGTGQAAFIDMRRDTRANARAYRVHGMTSVPLTSTIRRKRLHYKRQAHSQHQEYYFNTAK